MGAGDCDCGGKEARKLCLDRCAYGNAGSSPSLLPKENTSPCIFADAGREAPLVWGDEGSEAGGP